MKQYYLEEGNGHQVANRRRAMEYTATILPQFVPVNENTVTFPPYGSCHFASYTNELGAMISTPNRNDNDYGSADWHHKDHIMLFRDVGDGRGIIYVSPIRPLFGLRTIGHHGVTWANVLKTSAFKKVFRFPAK